MLKRLSCCGPSSFRIYASNLSSASFKLPKPVQYTGALAVAALLMCVGFYGMPAQQSAPVPPNVLANTNIPVIRIGKTLPQSFEGMQPEEILELRRKIVEMHSPLYSSTYTPSSAVFSQLNRKRPWFGTEGFYFYGIGPDSARGPAAASREILNPFMLAAAEFSGLSIWDSGSLRWNFAKATPAKIAKPGFPLYPEMTDIVWNAAESQAVALYKVSAFLEASAPYLRNPLTVSDVRFSLNTINARDWGLNYVSVVSEGLSNMASDGPTNQVIANEQSYTPTDLCGLEQECVHSTDAPPALASFRAKALPARVRLKFWREQPSDANAKADFEFSIGLT
ncbi:MAG: hypothetical protein J0M12_12510 [Deltaproteobacteria bacterium]|nr:hypothetical protein [Deltaproteobacteria bacterium]